MIVHHGNRHGLTSRLESELADVVDGGEQVEVRSLVGMPPTYLPQPVSGHAALATVAVADAVTQRNRPRPLESFHPVLGVLARLVPAVLHLPVDCPGVPHDHLLVPDLALRCFISNLRGPGKSVFLLV